MKSKIHHFAHSFERTVKSVKNGKTVSELKKLLYNVKYILAFDIYLEMRAYTIIPI